MVDMQRILVRTTFVTNGMPSISSRYSAALLTCSSLNSEYVCHCSDRSRRVSSMLFQLTKAPTVPLPIGPQKHKVGEFERISVSPKPPLSLEHPSQSGLSPSISCRTSDQTSSSGLHHSHSPLDVHAVVQSTSSFAMRDTSTLESLFRPGTTLRLSADRNALLHLCHHRHAGMEVSFLFDRERERENKTRAVRRLVVVHCSNAYDVHFLCPADVWKHKSCSWIDHPQSQ